MSAHIEVIAYPNGQVLPLENVFTMVRLYNALMDAGMRPFGSDTRFEVKTITTTFVFQVES